MNFERNGRELFRDIFHLYDFFIHLIFLIFIINSFRAMVTFQNYQ